MASEGKANVCNFGAVSIMRGAHHERHLTGQKRVDRPVKISWVEKLSFVVHEWVEVLHVSVELVDVRDPRVCASAVCPGERDVVKPRCVDKVQLSQIAAEFGDRGCRLLTKRPRRDLVRVGAELPRAKTAAAQIRGASSLDLAQVVLDEEALNVEARASSDVNR
eukprot:5685543-Prymnesium_polylepis.1